MAQASILSPSLQGGIDRDLLISHVQSEITRTCGPQLPCYKASEILGAFFDRFGDDCMAICDRAFNAHGGMWRGAPVTVLRFRESHDRYFSLPLLEEARSLAPAPSAGE